MENIRAIAHAHFHVFSFDLPGMLYLSFFFICSFLGHGRSAKGKVDSVIPSIPAVVDYWISFMRSVLENPQFKDLPSFFYGHSLGATIGILTMRKAKSCSLIFIYFYF